MLGEDSRGRKVDLLNDRASDSTTFTRPKLPTLSRPTTSSSSSCASREESTQSQSGLSHSPRHSHSPRTPPLVRYDSQSSLACTTPSPMTPQYGFEPSDQNVKDNPHPYYNQQFTDRVPKRYPLMQEQIANPYYNLAGQAPLSALNDFDFEQQIYNAQARGLQPLQTELQLQSAAFSNGSLAQITPQAFPTTSSIAITTPVPALSAGTPTPSAKADAATPSTSSNTTPSAAGKAPISKKKYPCPHAVRYKCTDTFTTSGHAARHGKKHTGEKNILCPTCNKAFTRKDNMKQHERTHKGGSRTGSTAASPVISNGASSRKGSVIDGDVMDMEEGNLTLTNNSAMPKRPKMQRSELSEIIEGISKGQAMDEHDDEMDADGEGESPGLDALATAASGMT